MAFTTKSWQNLVGGATPLDAAALIDLETRLAAYTDAQVAGASGGFLNVKAYGAVGNGSTNDSTAIAAAITALPAAGGTIIFPPGTYRCSGVTIPASPKRVKFQGSGVGTTTLKEITSAVTVDTDLITVTAGGWFEFHDMTLEGPTSVSGAHIYNLVHQGAGSGGKIYGNRVKLYKFGYAIWSEDTEIRLRDFELDGGSGGTALGSTVGGQGILQAPTSPGLLELRDGLVQNCGRTGSGLYHGFYIYPNVDSNVANVRFLTLYGTGFHAQHYNPGSTPGDYVNYADCYFGPTILGVAGGNGICVPPGQLTNIDRCSFELDDNAIIIGDTNARLKVSRCRFKGSASTNQQIALVQAGCEIDVVDCDFEGVGPGQIYCNANGNLIRLLDNRFKGATANDVELDTGLTTTEILARRNKHTGATAACYRTASGKRMTLQDNDFHTTGTQIVNNLSGSTLAELAVFGNDFSQTGIAATLTVIPAKYRARDNFGTKRLSDTPSDGMWTPRDHGVIAYAYDPSLPRNSQIMATAGRIHCTRLKMEVATSITNVILCFGAAGSGLTANQCLAALYQGGALIGVTGNQATNWASTGTKIMALTGGPFAVTDDDVVVAYFANGTTLPSPALTGTVDNLINLNLAAAASRYSLDSQTGRTTTFPATLATQTQLAFAYWAGVS